MKIDDLDKVTALRNHREKAMKVREAAAASADLGQPALNDELRYEVKHIIYQHLFEEYLDPWGVPRQKCARCAVDLSHQNPKHTNLPFTNNSKKATCPTTITLCGSTRFKRAWLEWNARLTLEGNVVFSVALWSHAQPVPVTLEQKELLDRVHLTKIDRSQEVFVLDVGGYIGDSTRREIMHAEATGKRVRYLSREYPGWAEDDCVLWQDTPS